MIRIDGVGTEAGSLASMFPQDSVESKIVNILSSSRHVYNYRTLEHLKFELNLRRSIINNSFKLYRSRMAFETFRNSRCNELYWNRTDEGGFRLNRGVKPSQAVRDIFINGSKYGTDCSTAIVIVYYGALLDLFPEELFNKLFSSIYLMDWKYLSNDLGVRMYRNVEDYLPGDCRYFKNPDVNPLTPEWQGENAIDLGNGTYYGHGIGITNADRILEALNEHRKEGADESAYLMDTVIRPDFRYLADRFISFNTQNHRVSPGYHGMYYRMPVFQGMNKYYY